MISLDIFRSREQKPFGLDRRSAVLLLIQNVGDKQYLILEKRALSMRSQPGDISFPGGRIEPGESPQEAAVRESCEELGVCSKDLKVIGPMEFYVTHYGTILYPYVAQTAVTEFSPNPAEVDELVFVPLNILLAQEPEVYPIRISPCPPEDFPYDRIQGGRSYRFSDVRVDEYFYRYKTYHIWGTTARILHQFLQVLKEGR